MKESALRQLVSEAVDMARNTSPTNMSDEAIIQRVLREGFVDGRWVSTLPEVEKQ